MGKLISSMIRKIFSTYSLIRPLVKLIRRLVEFITKPVGKFLLQMKYHRLRAAEPELRTSVWSKLRNREN